MRSAIILILSFFSAMLISSCANSQTKSASVDHKNNKYYSRTDTNRLKVTNEEWKKILPADVYEISRLKGTEYAFSGKYYKTDTKGTYYCVACGNPLFRSTDKFASTCGWPSFFESIRPNSVTYSPDDSHGMQRTEVTCTRCGGHLGHLFDDGPPPTYKRFCMNSLVLEFEPDTK